MKISNRVILIFILIIIVFLLLFNLLWFKDGKECLKNPMTYAAQKIYDQNDELEISCRCIFYEPGYNPFYFDRNEVKQEKDYSPSTELSNFSISTFS